MEPSHSQILIGPALQVVMHWLSSQPVTLVLMFLIIADIISGTIVAFITKKISSTVSLKGMARKAMMVIIVSIGFVVEPFAGGLLTGKVLCLFFIWTELVSISENAACLGVPLPEAWRNALLKFKESSTSVPILPVNTIEVKTTIMPPTSVHPEVTTETKP